jgi:hypothetical protein
MRKATEASRARVWASCAGSSSARSPGCTSSVAYVPRPPASVRAAELLNVHASNEVIAENVDVKDTSLAE